MAPTDHLGEHFGSLIARYYCSSYGYNNCNRSSWSYWGRWVFAGVVIVVVIAILVALGCINSRRRRKRGLNPRYGTGWMAPSKYGQQNNPNAYAPPPPQYTPNPGQYQPQNNYQQGGYQQGGYYGGQQEGIQQPQGAYYPRGNDSYYEAPQGPPPTK